MNNRILTQFGIFILTALLVSVGAVIVGAAEPAPMTPELAAKAFRVKTQQGQRITPAQRQAAAESLAAERLKLHGDQQAAPQTVQPVGQPTAPATVTQ